MRVIPATLEDYYLLYKLRQEYLIDSKQSSNETDIEFWKQRFFDPEFFCFLAHHGKDRRRFVGMVWGYQKPKKLEVEGIFIRRGFRQKFSAIRGLVGVIRGLAKSRSLLEVSVIVPENQIKGMRRKGFKPVATILKRPI